VKRVVISLCDYSGIALEPWAAAGYECWAVDLKHPVGEPWGPERDGIWRIGADVTRWYPPLDVLAVRPLAFLMAWPPCTDLAVSGARWFAHKGLDALSDALRIVSACQRFAEASGVPYLIENPVSTLSTYWRKPDYTFDPCDFAGYLDDPRPDAYTKRTCLWTGGGFVMSPRHRVEPVLGSKMHLLPPSEDRAELRSTTPRGFARAIFEANHPAVRPIARESACS
jgi:hypothetical protein